MCTLISGERPFHCELCDKRFLANSDLRRHQNTNIHLEKAQSNGAVFRYNEAVQNCVKSLALSAENGGAHNVAPVVPPSLSALGNLAPSSQNALHHNILSNLQPRT